MKTCLPLIYFLLFPYFQCHEQGPPEDEGLFNQYQWYYDIYINETTLSLPNFDRTYWTFLSVYLHGNIQISERELTTFFDKVENFMWGIQVNGTNLKNLSFLKPYLVNANDDGSNSSILIINNPNMTKIGIDFSQCTYCYDYIKITNNSQLDLKSECDGIIKIYGSNRVITDNLVDCGCTITGQFNTYLQTMEDDCYWLIGNVVIDQNTDPKLLESKLKNVTRITGGLSIINTTFFNFSFLSALEKVEENPRKTSVISSIIITGNKNLTNLGMNPIRDGTYLTIRDNPNLCVTVQQLEAFFNGLSVDSNLDIEICFDENSPKNVCKLPDSGKFSNLTEGCTKLVGDLMIDENMDFEMVYKLYDVEVIYGSLSIINSSLRNTFMLFHLQWIFSIKDGKIPLLVSNNTNLVNCFITRTFKGIESGSTTVFENNKNLKLSEFDCPFFATRISAVIKNNLANCKSNSLEPNPEKTNINIDIFRGVPRFPDVSHTDESEGSGDTQNQPVNGNETDYYIEIEVETTTVENNDSNCSVIVLLIITYLICMLISHF